MCLSFGKNNGERMYWHNMNEKIKIVLDISPVLQGLLNNANRTGIYQVNNNILLQMERSEDVDIYLYCKPHLFSILRRTKLSHYIDDNKVINWNELQYRLSICMGAIYKKKQCAKKNKNRVSWFFYAMLIEIIDRTVLRTRLKFSKLKLFDAFFSTYEQLPNCVLKHNNIIKVLYIHDVTMILHPELYSNNKSNPIFRIIKTISNSQLLFANSYNTKNDFINLRPDINPDKISVAYPGCSLDFDKMIIKSFGDIATHYHISKSKYAFSLCSVAPNKNLFRIVSTFLKFIKMYHIDDICLVLGGGLDGKYGEKLLEELHELDGFNQYVNYIGYVADEDLPALYKHAEWFVYTSQYEGFGTPVLEAMKCGCPVIVSNNSSLPEVVDRTGLLIPWDDDEAHIEAYRNYYFDTMLREQNSRLGKERANTFTWKKTVKFIVSSIYSEKNKRIAKMIKN